jgi:hypothetical protein
MTTLLPTPEPLVVDGKVSQFGLFKTPFRDLNILDADMGFSKVLRPFRLKKWQHIALVTKDLFMGFAITNAHYLSASFCYAVDLNDGRFVEHHREKPGASTARVAHLLWDDNCRFAVKNYDISIHNHLDLGRHDVRIAIAAKGKNLPIEGRFGFLEDLQLGQPLIVVLPVSNNRPLYTHKMVCPLEGEVMVGDRRYVFDSSRDLALLDVQKTYYPYDTTWRWATFAGYDANGRRLAMNLVKNMIEPDDQLNENVIWVDGVLSHLKGASFEFDLSDCLKPWKISTTDGRVNLEFTPLGERAECINMGVVVSDYHAPYGHYSGTITDDNGVSYTVDKLVGVAEFHRAKF